MRPLILSLVFLLPALATAAPGGPSRAQLEPTVTSLRADLAELKRLMDLPDTKANLHAIWEVQARMGQTLDRLDILADQADAPGPCVVAPPLPPPIPGPPPGPAPIGPERFEDLLAAVRAESFDSGKHRVIQAGTEGKHVNVAQVVALMGPFAMDKDKLEVATKLYPRCIDKDQWFRVHAALTYESTKKALQRATQ